MKSCAIQLLKNFIYKFQKRHNRCVSIKYYPTDPPFHNIFLLVNTKEILNEHFDSRT